MDPAEKRKIIELALEKYGIDHQIDKMIEELGELLQAIIKLRQSTRSGKITKSTIWENLNFESFVEELADFDVLRDQIVYAFELENDNSLFSQIKERKFKRLQQRLSQSSLEEFFD